MSLAEIYGALGLPVPDAASADAGQIMLSGAATDSRAVTPGDMFVCIAGERVDGHDFAAAAVQAGARAVLASRPVELPSGTSAHVVLASDTVKALGVIAHAWRQRFGGTVVGVTGSAGKTTVKEVLAQVLSVRGPTARNALNHNNQIGMPMSLLSATGEELFWVMEAGISQPRDMEELASVLTPDVGLIINAGSAHMEGLGDKGVAWHKARLLRHVRRGGVGLVCADYADLAREARAVFPQACFFSSTGRPMPYRAAYSGATPEGRGMYRLWLDGESLDVQAPFCGAYGAENAIAIASVAHELGLSGEEIARGFAVAELPRQRFQQYRVGGWRIIDDSYNANPLSMARMLDAAVEQAAGAPLYAVLGAMGELGRVAEREHEKLGRLLAQARVRAVFWRGGYMESVRAGLTAEGWPGMLHEIRDAAGFREIWRKYASGGGVVLCKGSRANHLEELVDILAVREETDNVL